MDNEHNPEPIELPASEIYFESGVTAIGNFQSFAFNHLFSAKHFTELSRKYEYEFQNEKDSGTSTSELCRKYFYHHRSYVISSIISAIAYWEASINEIFAETGEMNSGFFIDQLAPQVKNDLAKFWKIKTHNEEGELEFDLGFFSKLDTFQKYDLALYIAHKSPLDKSRSPYQDVSIVYKIRKELVHSKPELTWLDLLGRSKSRITSKAMKSIQSLEDNSRFAENPLVFGIKPFFPDRCLGHGCAKWALDSCVSFVEEFYSEMGLSPKDTSYISDRASDFSRFRT